MGYQYEVLVQGKWHSNEMVFATEAEANKAGQNKFYNWTLCDEYRVVETYKSANYQWTAHRGIIHIASED